MKNTLWNWNTTEAQQGQQQDAAVDATKFVGLLAVIASLLPDKKGPPVTRAAYRQSVAKPRLQRSRTIPQDVKIAVSVRDGGKCRICGSTVGLHYDHIVPYSLGGRSDDGNNFQLLCSRHNLRKGNRYVG